MTKNQSKLAAAIMAAAVSGALAIFWDGDHHKSFIILLLCVPTAFLFFVKLNKHLFNSSYDIQTYMDEDQKIPDKSDVVSMTVSFGVVLIMALVVFVGQTEKPASKAENSLTLSGLNG